MDKYKIVRENKYNEIKTKPKKSNKVKIIISYGILCISLNAFINPKNFLQNIQNTYYFINEFISDKSELNNLDSHILQDIQYFEKQILDIIPNEYLNNYYNNISTLKYYNNPYDLRKFLNSAGYYDAKWNRLVNITDYNSKQYGRVIFHELMHMASTTNNGMIGFMNKKGQGIGLMEGYTEYLVLKYFGKKINYTFENPHAYFVEVQIARIISLIIGEDKMLKYYFTNDMDNLKQNLCNIWGTKEEVDKLIANIDEYTLKKDKEKLASISESLMKYAYTDLINNYGYNWGNSAYYFEYNNILQKLCHNNNFGELELKVLSEISEKLQLDKKLIKYRGMIPKY